MYRKTGIEIESKEPQSPARSSLLTRLQQRPTVMVFDVIDPENDPLTLPALHDIRAAS